MADKLNPLVDFAFKRLFGVDENKDLLINLINAVVSEKDQIKDVEIKNPYNPQTFKTDKLSILDIKALGNNDQWYNIEVQVLAYQYYDVRTLYYWAKLYSSQLASGEKYGILQKTIVINFVNFNCLDEEDYHNYYKLINPKTHKEYSTDHIEIHFIELRKYHNELSTMLDKWANFLTKAHQYEKNKLPNELKTTEITKAMDGIEQAHLSTAEREEYDARLKYLRDEDAILGAAENKGLEKGMEIGMEKGREEGKHSQAMEIAVKLKQKGFSSAEIIESTGLTLNDIQNL